MVKYIPLSVPSVQGNEWQYIKECLDTEWVSSAGKYVDLFEETFIKRSYLNGVLLKSALEKRLAIIEEGIDG